METRLATKEDLGELKTIWKLCFHDEDSFIDFYFENRDWINGTAVLLSQGKVASMLTMIPVGLIGKNGEQSQASMLYAIATHPEFQKRGFADRLIEFSNQYLQAEQVPVTLLVPASEALFRYYEKCGYGDSFFVREAVMSRSEIEQLDGHGQAVPIPPSGYVQAASVPSPRHAQTAPMTPCRITPAEPAEYNRIRRKLLKGRFYLDYRDEEFAFEKRLALMSGTDLYSIEVSGSEGCVYAERISQEEVIVKELLAPDAVLPLVLKSLSELLTAEKYIIRTPSDAGYPLGGAVRHFGMIRINSPGGGISDPAVCSVDTDSWLGVAFD